MKAIAIEPAFYAGNRLRVGQEFDFDGEVLPKWARPADKPMPAPKKVFAGDTKPAKASAASKGKAANAGGGPGPDSLV